jgi:hypothetical protein
MMHKRNITLSKAATLLLPLRKKAFIALYFYPKQPLLSMKHLNISDEEKRKWMDEYNKKYQSVFKKFNEINDRIMKYRLKKHK